VLSRVVPFVRKITVCCACALVLAFGTTTALAAPADAPVPLPQPASTSTTAPAPEANPGTELADFAQQYVGSPYRWGGASPSGFDCTGFVMWVYSQFGVSLPHNEAGQLASGDRVSADDLEPGDVLVFANTYRAGLSHTGIYLGDGQFVHAADERHGVTVSALWDGYWGPRLVGATRAIS
jgi:cell wall-associated NlpC family hydrolase